MFVCYRRGMIPPTPPTAGVAAAAIVIHDTEQPVNVQVYNT